MKNIVKKLMTFAGVTIIPFCVLLLVHKFLFKSEHWVLEPLTFMIGWVIGYLAILVIKTMFTTYSTSNTIHISILCSIVVLTIAGAISLIFNTPTVHSYAFRAAFAFVFSIFSNSLIVGNTYSEEDELDNEAEDEELGFEADDIENINDIF